MTVSDEIEGKPCAGSIEICLITGVVPREQKHFVTRLTPSSIRSNGVHEGQPTREGRQIGVAMKLLFVASNKS